MPVSTDTNRRIELLQKLFAVFPPKSAAVGDDEGLELIIMAYMGATQGAQIRHLDAAIRKLFVTHPYPVAPVPGEILRRAREAAVAERQALEAQRQEELLENKRVESMRSDQIRAEAGKLRERGSRRLDDALADFLDQIADAQDRGDDDAHRISGEAEQRLTARASEQEPSA